MRKYDKSLVEVWEWKDKVYQDVKDLDDKEYADKVRHDAEKILTDSRITLKTISAKKKHQKVA